eukprot:3939184-Rhodomonas_salina.2
MPRGAVQSMTVHQEAYLTDRRWLATFGERIAQPDHEQQRPESWQSRRARQLGASASHGTRARGSIALLRPRQCRAVRSKHSHFQPASEPGMAQQGQPPAASVNTGHRRPRAQRPNPRLDVVDATGAGIRYVSAGHCVASLEAGSGWGRLCTTCGGKVEWWRSAPAVALTEDHTVALGAQHACSVPDIAEHSPSQGTHVVATVAIAREAPEVVRARGILLRKHSRQRRPRRLLKCVKRKVEGSGRRMRTERWLRMGAKTGRREREGGSDVTVVHACQTPVLGAQHSVSTRIIITRHCDRACACAGSEGPPSRS